MNGDFQSNVQITDQPSQHVIMIDTQNGNSEKLSMSLLTNESGTSNDFIPSALFGTNFVGTSTSNYNGTFYSQPSGQAAENFNLSVYSVSVQNLSAAPVPEPATWLSMIAGFGLIGVQLRRRRIRAVETRPHAS